MGSTQYISGEWYQKVPKTIDEQVAFLKESLSMFGIGNSRGVLVLKEPIRKDIPKEEEQVNSDEHDLVSWTVPTPVQTGGEYRTPYVVTDGKKYAGDAVGLRMAFGRYYTMNDPLWRVERKPLDKQSPEAYKLIELGLKRDEVIARDGILHDWPILAGIDEDNYHKIDAQFRQIQNPELRDLLRMGNLSLALGRELSPYRDVEELHGFKFEDILKNASKEFVKRLFDYSIRRSISSGHRRAYSLLSFLADHRDYTDLIDPVHMKFSIPFLVKREASSLKPEIRKGVEGLIE